MSPAPQGLSIPLGHTFTVVPVTLLDLLDVMVCSTYSPYTHFSSRCDRTHGLVRVTYITYN